ncbi:MAG: hypothetical protein IJ741_00660 [Schwartzia sp.]|nr:hypothetical protein [Schwartzia sp. (in: firmicutes)]
MFELFETVKIKSSGIVGTIVDKTIRNGKAKYIIESDTYVNPSGKPYCGDWPLFDCVDEDLVAVREARADAPEYREAAAL